MGVVYNEFTGIRSDRKAAVSPQDRTGKARLKAMSNFDLPTRHHLKPVVTTGDGSGSPVPKRKPAVPVDAAEEVFVPMPGRKPMAPPQAASSTPSSVSTTSSGRAATLDDFAESARSAARIANVSFADVMAHAAQESNFNPNLHSHQSSAAGPFQFVEHTWLELIKRHGAAYGLGREAAQIKMHNGVASVADPALRKRLLDLRSDVGLSSGMAARYLDESSHDLGHALKRKPTVTESRIAYLLGPGGAAKLIRAVQQNPEGSAAASLPQAAAANRPLFYGNQGPLSNREAMTKISHFVNRHLADFAALGKEQAPLTTDRLALVNPNVG